MVNNFKMSLNRRLNIIVKAQKQRFSGLIGNLLRKNENTSSYIKMALDRTPDVRRETERLDKE